MSNTDNMRVSRSSPRSSPHESFIATAALFFFFLSRLDRVLLPDPSVAIDSRKSGQERAGRPLLPFGAESLQIDAELDEGEDRGKHMTTYLGNQGGGVCIVALSGGIDSSTVAALCVEALGTDRVFGVHMTEQESSPETLMWSQLVPTRGNRSPRWRTSRRFSRGRVRPAPRRRDPQGAPDYGQVSSRRSWLPSVIDSDSSHVLRRHLHPDGTTKTADHHAGLSRDSSPATHSNRAHGSARVIPRGPVNYAVTGSRTNRLEYGQGFS